VVRTFIQISSLVFTLEAALFLARAGLSLSPAAIAELAATKWEYNFELAVSLAAQRADTTVGLTLLVIGFALQLGNALWPLRWSDFAIHRGAAVCAVVVSIIIGIGAHYTTQEWAATTALEARQLFEARLDSPQSAHVVQPEATMSPKSSPDAVSRVLAVIAVAISSATFVLGPLNSYIARPEIEYSVTWLDSYGEAPTTQIPSLSMVVIRPELPGGVLLKYGAEIHLRSIGRKPASNVQIRVKAAAPSFIVQIHADDRSLAERLAVLGRQGSEEVFTNVPLMVPGEAFRIRYWYGIPNEPGKEPARPIVAVRHAERQGRLVAP
jgi:hypothetical protein